MKFKTLPQLAILYKSYGIELPADTNFELLDVIERRFTTLENRLWNVAAYTDKRLKALEGASLKSSARKRKER
jgi:hypothetical protein